jgi:hypothetical protein
MNDERSQNQRASIVPLLNLFIVHRSSFIVFKACRLLQMSQNP